MIAVRWCRYVSAAYRPATQVPLTVLWAVGLTALFASAAGGPRQWRPGPGLALTAVTVAVDMLLLRALDDVRDHEYDREHNPGRPLPTGMVRERDLVALAAVGGAALLVLNAGRGVADAALAVQFAISAAVIGADRLLRWPPEDRVFLNLAVNLPLQSLISAYVYTVYLRAEHLRPDAEGATAIVAATLGGLCLELGRKATRTPRPGERTYSTVIGPGPTSAAAAAAALAGAAVAVALLRPWDPASAGHGWGWLAAAPALLPLSAAARFAAGRARWPARTALAYLPTTYAAFLVVGWITKGVPR